MFQVIIIVLAIVSVSLVNAHNYEAIVTGEQYMQNSYSQGKWNYDYTQGTDAHPCPSGN